MVRIAALAVALLTAGAAAGMAQERPAPYAGAPASRARAASPPPSASTAITSTPPDTKPADEPVRRPRAYIDRRYDNMVRQALDFSCGAAALATVLRHYWGMPVGEAEVIDTLKRRYPGNLFINVVRSGFSFDDLIFAAEQFGFAGEGGKVLISELEKLAGPVIVHLSKEGFQHFVVLRRARGNFAYVADPIAGNVIMPYSDFYRQYTGSALAIWRANASLPDDRPLMSPRPVGDMSLPLGAEIMRPLPPPYPMIGR
jgi:uncharacterized protein